MVGLFDVWGVDLVGEIRGGSGDLACKSDTSSPKAWPRNSSSSSSRVLAIHMSMAATVVRTSLDCSVSLLFSTLSAAERSRLRHSHVVADVSNL